MDYSVPKLRHLGAQISSICSTGSAATGGTYRGCNDGGNVGKTVDCSTGNAADPRCNTGNEANSAGSNGCYLGNSAVARCSSGSEVGTGKEVCSTGTTATLQP